MKANKEKPNINNNHGFTLIEVLLAIVILSLVSAPILRGFVVTANTSARARQIMEATDVAQIVVEEISATSFEDTGGFSDTFLSEGSKTRLSSVSYVSGGTVNPSLNQPQWFANLQNMAEDPTSASYPVKECYINGQADADGLKLVGLPNVEYDGKKYDVIIAYKPNNSEGNVYYTYDITVQVYGQEEGEVVGSGGTTYNGIKHYQHLFVTLETQISNKY